MASAIGSLALPVLAWPSPAHADLTVCNETSQTVRVAVSYLGPSGSIVSERWYKLNPGGACRLLVSSSQTIDPNHYSVSAHTKDWSQSWGGGGDLCTTSKPFTIVDAAKLAKCSHNGGRMSSFFFVTSPSVSAAREF
jgi:uncharacterized membrane protein